MRGIGILAVVNSLQQKLILNYLNWKPTLNWNGNFFFPKRNIIFLGKKKRKLENNTSLYYYGQNRIENDEKVENLLREDESDGK